MKIEISGTDKSSDDECMALGAELLRDKPPEWGRREQCLLLNPRLPAAWSSLILAAEFPAAPGRVWLATSGTGGKLKIVALSCEALEASARAVNAHLAADAHDMWINPLPLFHVGGLGIVVRAALTGGRCEFLENWNAREYVKRAAECDAALSSLVPAQVHDVVAARLSCPPSLRAIVVGGGALDETLRASAAELGWPLLPSYGLSEASSQVATAAPGAEDFPWLPLLGHIEARVGDDGLLELRGPSLLTGWIIFESGGSSRWEDPKRDGWFRTNDRCELRDRKLRVLGRADDLVKIRGELVDVAALERELQLRVSSGLVRVDVEPDVRNGARLSVVAENKHAESEARGAADWFPPYAKPSSFRVGRIEVSPLGKKIRIANTSL